MSGANRPSPRSSLDWRLARNIVVKAALLLLLVNFGFAWLKPLPFLGRVSAYNHLFPGRTRLPYGENPSRDYSLSPFSLEALVASHEIAATLPVRDEYRVVLIGDSSAWGFLLPANQTMAAYINAASLTTASGRPVHLFNLGYPIMSLMKDLVLLDRAMDYHPDLIVWLVTLESFPTDKQLYPPLLQHNPDTVRRLIRTYDLTLDPYDPRLVDPSFWDQTLIGQRRALADLLRLDGANLGAVDFEPRGEEGLRLVEDIRRLEQAIGRHDEQADLLAGGRWRELFLQLTMPRQNVRTTNQPDGRGRTRLDEVLECSTVFRIEVIGQRGAMLAQPCRDKLGRRWVWCLIFPRWSHASRVKDRRTETLQTLW
jgi:hypothetical protein